MRTSSIRPAKYSPHTELPPTRSAPDVSTMLPVIARVRASVPLTYIRRLAPSYVAARCVQALTASAAVPQESTSPPPVLMKPAGAEGERSGSVAYSEYDKEPGRSFSSTVRQPLTEVGLTHASSVMPLVSRRPGASFTVTQALVPLKERAPPNLPAADQAALLSVPVFALPERSAAVEPVPSLKP